MIKKTLENKIKTKIAKELNVKSSQITFCESGDNGSDNVDYSFNVFYNKYLSKGYQAFFMYDNKLNCTMLLEIYERSAFDKL